MSPRLRSYVFAAIASLAFAACTPSSSDAPAPSGSGAPKTAPASNAPASTAATAAASAVPRKPKGADEKLTAADCDAIMQRLMDVTWNEELATDPELKNASAAEREVVRSAMRSEALKDPEMKKIVADCRTTLRGKAYECIMKAKTSKQIDACM